MLFLLIACWSASTYHTQVVWDDGSLRLVLEKTVTEAFPDNTASYTLRLGDTVVHQDALQDHDIGGLHATEIDGVLYWTIRDTICRHGAGGATCSSFDMFEEATGATFGCCDGATVSCSCGMLQPNPLFTDGYRWVAEERIGWRLRRGAVGALVALGDAAAPEQVDRLRMDFPNDPWAEGLQARIDPLLRPLLAAGLGDRPLYQRTLIARACVPGFAAKLRATESPSNANRWGALGAALAFCPWPEQ